MSLMANESQCSPWSNSTDGAARSAEMVFTLLYCVIIVLGLFFNVAALWIFQCHICLRSSTTVYMRNLAFADLLLVCFLPFRISYYHRPSDHTSLPCEIATIIFLVNMYTSIFFLACISLDRCLATVLPLKVQMWRLHRVAPWVSVVVWLLTVGASLPFYLRSKLSKSADPCLNCLKPIAVTKSLSLVPTLTIGFGLPFCLVLTCSLLALVTVRKSLTSSSQLQQARKTQNMILANFLVFTGCFLPYHLVLCFYEAWAKHSPHTAEQLFRAAQLLASTNAVLDPVVYYFTTEAFQKTNLMKAVHNFVLCRWNTRSVMAADTEGEHRGSYKKTTEVANFI
ncbi:lysophosphatidic acid receptor 6-like [Heptranchias perlo]|uniref:lysophosphatidic acid receptor 6-like n=1 Tax=Heptranchias perlo TaxID=212740 RepID=UPI003559E2D0